jgi:hypothetical protein
VARGFDSSVSPWLYLSGNYSNKFSVTDVGAIVGAARLVAEKLRRLAGHRLEIAPADLDLRDGAVVVRGAPDRRVAFAELCRTAYADVLGLPPGEAPGIEAHHAYQNPLAAPCRCRPARALPARLLQRGALLPGRSAPAHGRGHRAQVRGGA